jgi:shikimate kinase
MPSATPPNIVLTGFMGTGKTTVGRLVAELIGYEFVDTDDLIERRHGPVSEIFREHGEARFRELERELVAELAGGERRVISTGGRLMLDPVNAEVLEANSRVFCLTAAPDVIAARVLVDGAPARPLLAGDDPTARIAELLEERRDGYARFEQVDTTARTPTQVADDIITRSCRAHPP